MDGRDIQGDSVQVGVKPGWKLLTVNGEVLVAIRESHSPRETKEKYGQIGFS